MKRGMTVPLIASACVAGLISCGGGGSSTALPPAGPAPSTGYSVPTEISPVSTTAAAQPAARLRTLAAPAGTAPGTDYSNALTSRFVDEHAIDQFSIIETILNATAQTHYADAENLDAGPYKSIVTWQENGKDSGGITTQTWVVDSHMVAQLDGSYVNVVDAWIEDSGRLIKGQFRIAASAAQRADGSYQDYGKWTLNVKFDDLNSQYFFARADVDASGATTLAINNHEQHEGQGFDRKGVVHKGDSTGFGKVTYSDWQNNGIVTVTAAYAYNASQLLENVGSGDVYKDRAATVDIVRQYGMYLADTGADVLKSHSFGFPVTFQNGATTLQGYYGAFQGRHSLWTPDGSPIPDGTTVTRQDPNGAGASYQTVSYTGTLTRRSLQPASVNDLLDLPLQTWVNFQHQLSWDGTGQRWTENGAPFTDWTSLAAAPQKQVFINGWVQGGQGPMMVNLVYDAQSGSFYQAAMNNGAWVSTGQVFTPQPGASLWVNISGSIYLQYTGSGWVQKQVTAVDPSTFTPSFGPVDTPFTPVTGYQYYMNLQGTNYVVTATGPGAYDVQMEVQTACNPMNLLAVLGSAASFRPQNYNPSAPGQTSTFAFVTDPASSNFLKLVCTSVGSLDRQSVVNQPVTQGQWGLTAVDASGAAAGQFNWDYPQMGQNFGTQTFLYNLDGNQDRAYTLVEGPIALAPLTLQTYAGASRAYSMRYDGWMQGLPQWDNLLAQNGWNITDAVAAQVANIPVGTIAQDLQNPAIDYLIKPLKVGVYLKPAAVPDPTLTLDAATAIDLSAPGVLPEFADNGMGPEPAVSQVKYIGGIKVQ